MRKSVTNSNVSIFSNELRIMILDSRKELIYETFQYKSFPYRLNVKIEDEQDEGEWEKSPQN